jgi:hypothetical protein
MRVVDGAFGASPSALLGLVRTRKEAIMKVFSVHFLAALLCAGAAVAQDDPLEGGGAFAEDGLVEKKPAEQPVVDDPDGALLKKTDELRTKVEANINKLQEAVGKMREIEVELTKGAAKKFEGFDKRLEKVTAELLKATDGYMEKHAADLDAYRAALGQGMNDAKDKAGKAVIKHRETFIKALEKVEKSAEGLAKDAEAFTAKFAPPPAAPPSEAAPATEAPAPAGDEEEKEGE